MNNILGLYSKRPEYTGLPKYYDKAKDVSILINKYKLIDMSTMGLGCNILGYSNFHVNSAVKKVINKGNNSSLNCYEDEELANILLHLNPGFKKVRYAKTGGEAMYIALKLAQYYMDTTDFIQCGYSGWGIENLKAKKFQYNNIADLREKYNGERIILIEAIRNLQPNYDFWHEIEELQKNGVIVIIDEITSGFRFRNGGYYQNLMQPDILVFGKAISNGYSLSAILMNDRISLIENKVFISSTYFTERIGVSAAIATIKQLQNKSFNYLNIVGNTYRLIITKLSKYYKINVKMNEVNQLFHWEFEYVNKMELLTFFVQEMFKKGIIVSNSFYPCFMHRAWHMSCFEKIANEIFKKIIEVKFEVMNLLEIPIIKEVEIRKDI